MVIKIGAILPLTGDAAVWGNNTKKGIDLAVEEIGKKGGVNGKKIKIIYLIILMSGIIEEILKRRRRTTLAIGAIISLLVYFLK